MTPQERRGKRLFVVLATLITLEKLASIGLALSNGFGEVTWWKSVGQPAGFALAVGLLWYGDVWLRWLVGFGCLLTGGLPLFVTGRLLFRLAEVTPPDATEFFMQVVLYPVALAMSVSLFYVLAGLLFLFSTSMRAFFAYQCSRAQGRSEALDVRFAELTAELERRDRQLPNEE
jgi:hypothetical protein